MSKYRNFLAVSTFLTVVAAATSAQAAVISLNFEGVNATYPSGFAQVGGFYNGGTSSDATSGTNFGVEFTDNALAICLNTPGTVCSNTSRGGIGDPASDKGGLFFLSGAETFMNVAAGFDTGFSFNYAAINQGGTINVFDGLGGTGTLLGSIVLGLTTSNCGPEYSAGFCPFVSAFVAFAGIAKSVSFGGVANQIVFDDVTFGSITPGSTIPVPAALPLLLTAIGGLGVASRFRKNRTAA